MPNSKFRSLSEHSFIDLIGPGTVQFFKGQLTINTDSIDEKTAKLAGLCNHKGRIISLFHIVAIENGFRLIMPKSIVNTSLAHIKKYSVFFKLEIVTSENNALVACIGNENDIADSILIDNTDMHVKFEASSNLDHSPAIDGFLWYWHLLDKGIPWLTAETVEQFLPHSLNLPELNAIDFNKGCFTGQEVIARMQYKGKLKQHLRTLSTSNRAVIPPLSNLEQSNRKVAQIVCGVVHPDRGQRVLAVVKDSADSDKNFQLELENGSILDLEIIP
jgi:folate-binding protein YgfZ